MNTLADHLLAQSACLDDFIAALAAEDEALRLGRLHELPALTDRKNALLGCLAGLDQAREAAQLALGQPPGRAGADAAAASLGLQQVWAALLARAQQARDLNQRVAAMVFTHMDHTRQALGILRADRQPALYGRDGVSSAAASASARAAR